MNRPDGIPPRFWAKVVVDEDSGCWLWTGANTCGYGRWRTNSRLQLAHRVAYELLRGSVAEGMTVDHLCRVTRCVNPEHMEVVTRAENIRRAWATQTHCKNGHPLEGDNLASLTTRPERRICITCRREYNRRWRANAAASRAA